MRELSYEKQGDFSFCVRPLREDERKFFGIFVSHSNAAGDTRAKEHFEVLVQALHQAHLYALCDRDFLRVGVDFQSVIEGYLDCYAGIFLVSEGSLSSAWCNYEIGVFSGHKMPVFLWDPDGILTDEAHYANLTTHIGKYLPAYRTLEDLMKAVQESSPYADMCLEENGMITKRDFLARLSQRVETVMISLKSSHFAAVSAELSRARIGMLIVNFGMFYPDQCDGMHCYTRRFANSLQEGICPHSGVRCALLSQEKISQNNRECVILNHVLYNGKYLRPAERDIAGNTADAHTLLFHAPLHTLFGTEFKIILDVSEDTDYERLTQAFAAAGLEPSGSFGYVGGRIYLSLPDRRESGLFRLSHEFSNDFLCPRAAKG